MKTTILFSVLLAAVPVLAADTPAEISGAAKKLAQTDNYSWKTTVESPGGNNRFRAGPTDGKTEKDGYTVLTMTRGDNTSHAVLKGSQGALKPADGDWQSLADAEKDDGGGGFNAARFMAMMLRNYKMPAAEVESLASKTKELKMSDGAYSGDLTEEGAKSLLTFGRPGGNGPEVSEAKGSVKIWLKDGMVSKYQFNVQGHVEFNGNGRDVNRTTTVEIKDVGTTKVEVPEEAKKKIS